MWLIILISLFINYAEARHAHVRSAQVDPQSTTLENIGAERKYDDDDDEKFKREYSTYTGTFSWAWCNFLWLFGNCNDLDNIKLLGEGNFGSVYLYVNEDKQNLAVKVFSAEADWWAERDELSFFKGLKGVMHMIRSFRFHSTLAIVLPLADGGDMENPSVSMDELRKPDVQGRITSDIITGIKSLQENQVVACDIKPGRMKIISNN
jgi:hypothetical protein